MCVQTVAKWPAARVAIQPPSVASSNDCGKWRRVRPCSPSAASRAGPVAPAPMRAARETPSSSSRPSRFLRSMDMAPFVAPADVGRDAPDDRRPAAVGDRGDVLGRAPLQHPLHAPALSAGARRSRAGARTGRGSRARRRRRTCRARARRARRPRRRRSRRAAAGSRRGAARAAGPASATGCSGSPSSMPSRSESAGAEARACSSARLLVLAAPPPVLAPAAAHGRESMLRSCERDGRAEQPGARDPRARTVGDGADHRALAARALRAVAGEDRGRRRGDPGPAGARLAEPRRPRRAPRRLQPGRAAGSRSSCSRCAGRCGSSPATPRTASPRSA